MYAFKLDEVVVSAFLTLTDSTFVLLKMSTLHLNIPSLFLRHLAIICSFPLFYKAEVGSNHENTGCYSNGSKDPKLYPLQIHIEL